MLIMWAPAKVNLALRVIGRRPDGYHLLDSLVVFAAVGDRISAAPAEALSLTIGGPFANGLAADAGNLVLRAAHAARAAAWVTAGAALHLEKNLPVASGLGGGSSDAAATLRLVMRLWGIRLAEDVCGRIAASLGADVPVCLSPGPRRMGGIGEVLSAAPRIPACGIVLVNPGVAVATPEVFKARQGGFSPPSAWPAGWEDAASLARDLAADNNDLQAAALSLCPQIGGVLRALASSPACLLARMSGSGATCFGLFPTPGEAERAATALARTGWWCWGGGLAAGDLYGTPTVT